MNPRGQHLPPPATAPHVDLNRYLGTWYEIAAFPQSFPKGCTGTTATYSLRADGHPSRDYLWILSRAPTLDAAVYDGIRARLRAQGYEVERLRRTLQPPNGS